MKTTLDIPDALYRQFKTRVAMNGETMRNVTLNFIISYVADSAGVALPTPAPTSLELPSWLGCGAPYLRMNKQGPHDMPAVRASVARQRFAKES